MAELDKPKTWETITEDKQKNCQEVYYTLKKIIEFNNKCTQKLFVHLYGQQLGEHLWETFVMEHKRDFMSFYNYLNEGNRSVIIVNVFDFDERRSSSANPLYAHCN